MTLKGLPESPLPAGSVVITSFVSVFLCTAGLALLRCTRPSKVRLLPSTGKYYGGFPPCLLYNVLGIFGALLLYLGLVVGSFPMLMGVSTDDEGKAAAIVHCTQVLACWAMERYKILGHALPMMQSCACAVVWFGSTLVEWAGPRPYDNISLGLRSQISGCDGGYRSPFLVYAAGWLTCITFGVLFLCCEEGGAAPARGDDEDGCRETDPPTPSPKVLTYKALPAIYGATTSMSGMVFAVGTSTNDMRWVFFGALLLVVAVACAWEWLWCVEAPLGTWAPVSHCFAALARLGQAHLVFRDFRWDPDSVNGILVVWRWPGIPLFLFGLFLLMAMLQVYINTCTWREWGSGVPVDAGKQQGSKCEDPRASLGVCSTCLYMVQCMLLVFCMACCIIGIQMPLIQTTFFVPETHWLANEEAIAKFENSTRPGNAHAIKSGSSYLDLISELYAGRVPCSALVVAYNSVIMPPLQFLGFILVLLGKPRLLKISEETMSTVSQFALDQAPKRFTNPMILMSMVALVQLTAPAGRMQQDITRGYWYYISYCASCLILAWSLNFHFEESEVCSRPKGWSSRRLDFPGRTLSDAKVQLSKAIRATSGDALGEDEVFSDLDSEAGPAHSQAADSVTSSTTLAFVGLVPLTLVSLYFGLTSAFLNIDYRLSGITLKKTEPSVYELWLSLGEKSTLLQVFAAITLIFTMLVWILLLVLRVVAKAQQRPGSTPGVLVRLLGVAEQTVRPWVLGHVWAFCFVLIYYIVTARNKAPAEVCAHFPDWPVGMAAIFVLGGSVYALRIFGKQLVDSPRHSKNSKWGSLPGGIYLWGMGAMAVGSFWCLILYAHGPTLEPEIASLEDVNTVLSKILPVTNQHLHSKIPESAGDCGALWEHRVATGKALYASPRSEVHRNCKGKSPLAHQKKNTGQTDLDVTAKWARGLNTLEIMDILILPPTNVSAYTQEWNMTFRAKFSDLRVWLKVILGDSNKPWVDDYMCCDKAFHFTIQASVRCTLGYGFRPIQLHVLHMDPIIFKHHGELSRSGDFRAEWNIDYGRSDDLEKVLKNFLTGKQGKVLFKNSDGSTTDPLASASDVLNNIVFLNTGQQCLYKW